MKKFKYPLQTDNFSLWDRLKVCAFILDKRNRLTMSEKVAGFERDLSKISHTHTVATSSGSTANHLLVETFLQSYNIEPKDVTVFCPATTWASSVTPWIMRGCKIKFVDINLDDFSFNYFKLEGALAANKSKHKVLWPTALIGFIPDIARLKSYRDRFSNESSKTHLFADLCETTLGSYPGQNISILNAFDMSTTSFFWAHEICSIEGGALFIRKDYRDEAFFENASMIRNHGLVRSLPESSGTRFELLRENPCVHPQFLFAKLGTNYRMAEINALFGSLDLKRAGEYENHRRAIWKFFNYKIPAKFLSFLGSDIVPFCLPFIFQYGNTLEMGEKDRLMEKFESAGWETRPIISFLPLNPAFRKYSKDPMAEFPNSSYLNDFGFYVGLNKDTREKDIQNLFKLC